MRPEPIEANPETDPKAWIAEVKRRNHGWRVAAINAASWIGLVSICSFLDPERKLIYQGWGRLDLGNVIIRALG